MITIVKAVQTSIACPAQWDMWDESGNYYYARFRSGSASVIQYEDEDWVGAPFLADPEDGNMTGWAYRGNVKFIGFVAHFTDEDEYRGWISLEEFCERAGLALAPDLVHEGFGDYVMGKLADDGIVAEEGSELARIRDKWNEASE
jgi:hypothetical protein